MKNREKQKKKSTPEETLQDQMAFWRRAFVPPESFDFSSVAAAGEVRWLQGRGLRCHSADVLAAIELRHLRRRATPQEGKQLTLALANAVEEGRLRRELDGTYREAKGAAAGRGPAPRKRVCRAPTGGPSYYFGDNHYQSAWSFGDGTGAAAPVVNSVAAARILYGSRALRPPRPPATAPRRRLGERALDYRTKTSGVAPRRGATRMRGAWLGPAIRSSL